MAVVVAPSAPTIALRLRGDLLISRQGTPEQTVYVIKDPASGRFFRFGEVEFFVAQQLSGEISAETVQERVAERFGTELSEETLEQFIERLRGIGLLTTEQFERRSQSYRPGRIGGNIFYIRLKAFDPDRFFGWLVDKIWFLFTPGFVILSAALIATALGLTYFNWADVQQEFLRWFQFESLLLAWVTIVAVIALHEFAHGLTCKHFGGHVHELGFLLLYFEPAFYCNVSDAWLFPEKSNRLWVTFAGAYFEMFLWAVSTIVWRMTDYDTTLNHIALIVTATSVIKSLFNLNPLIKLDGYYVLSDYLEIPNLRQKAFAYLGARTRSLWGKGAEWLQYVSKRERRIYLAYGLLAASYTYWILALVAIYVGDYLVQRYQAWGFIVFILLLGGLARNSLRRSLTGLRAACDGSAATLRFLTKVAKALMIFGGLAAALYLLPMELKVSGDFSLLPIRNADVRAEVEGFIQEIPHDEGDLVHKGDVIARLYDRDTRAELRQLAAQIEENQAKLKMLKIGARPEEIALAQTNVKKADEQLQYARSRFEMDSASFKQSLLSRRAYEAAEEELASRQKDLDGAKDRLKLLLAGSRPEEIQALEAQLNRLHAQQSYLDDQLKLVSVTSPVTGVIATHRIKEELGQHVEKGDLIAAVDELQTIVAEIAVSEKEISDVKVGQKVILKARAYPQETFRGTVTSIAPVATAPKDWPQQRTLIVETALDNTSMLLRAGMSGRAKIYCGEHRALDLLGRQLIRYLRVEFWSWW